MNANGFWRGLSPDGLSFSRAAITPESYQVEIKKFNILSCINSGT